MLFFPFNTFYELCNLGREIWVSAFISKSYTWQHLPIWWTNAAHLCRSQARAYRWKHSMSSRYLRRPHPENYDFGIMTRHVSCWLKTLNLYSYLLLTKISLLKSSAYSSRTEASFFAYLPISNSTKVPCCWSSFFFLYSLVQSTSQDKLRSLIAQLFPIPLTEDEQFEADKAQVVREIAALEPQDRTWDLIPASFPLSSVRKHRSVSGSVSMFCGHKSLAPSPVWCEIALNVKSYPTK